MKASQITEYSGPSGIKTILDVPKPTIGVDQVLVEVHAASINPFDIKVAQGHARQMAELNFPATLGGDLAGIVAEVGAEVEGLKVGDAVYGQAGALSSHGSFAEFAPAKAQSLSPKPTRVDFNQAAAIPLVAVSAYQAIVELLDVKSGQSILIHGGAGGIGSVAIQLAKHLGATVAATANTSNLEFVKSLGADIVIDYKTQRFQDEISDYDAVFDTFGGDVYPASYQVLKKGGAIVSMTTPPDEELMKQYGVKASSFYTQVTTQRLSKISELVQSGVVSVKVEKVFTLDQVAEAMDYLTNNSVQGKLVISIRE